MYDQIKTQFVSLLLTLVTVFTLLPAVPAFAAETQDAVMQDVTVQDSAVQPMSSKICGWGQITSKTDVYKWGNLTKKIGSLSAGEGVTVLYCDGTIAEIDYSSSTSGHKMGYIGVSHLRSNGPSYGTSYGLVTTASSTYYDLNRNFPAGSVSVNEYVAIITAGNGWSYIEYNVSGGKRKRAFVPSNCISAYDDSARNHYIYDPAGKAMSFTIDTAMTVYSGPDSEHYAPCGSISAHEPALFSYWQTEDRNHNPMSFISYYAGDKIKYGWISHRHGS